jgi:predicted transcriptional regulator of viral defense system
MINSKRQQVLDMLRKGGVLRPRDVEAAGISGEWLNRLHAEGIVDRPSRGLYALPSSEPSEHRTIAEVCKRVPRGVICLLTALRFHELTTQAPFEIWMAIGENSRAPRVTYPPLRIVRFSGLALRFGVQERLVEGVRVHVYSPAKTVADCFKYRNKIGIDVAIEALRDCRRQRKASSDEVWEAAKVCRMTNVIRPYLESLT